MKPLQLPPIWESLLKGYVKRTFYVGTRKEAFAGREDFTEGDYRFFATGIRALNEAFTRERGSLPRNYLNKKELRSGYILYFLPVNALKVEALLSPWRVTEILKQRSVLRILDIGSGPGTGILGTLLFLGPQKKVEKLHLEITLVDQNRETLKDAELLIGEAFSLLQKQHPGWTLELRLSNGDILRDRMSEIVKPSEFDLILCLNVLNELPSQKREALLHLWLHQYLAGDGHILMMEPALRSTTRALMELHDAVVTKGLGVIEAPCLHQAECPMLRDNDRDWCHTYIPWDRPQWIEKIDRLVGIRKDYLKCSYLLIGKQPVHWEDNIWRVVSGPLNSKGKSERLLCGKGNLPHLLRIVRLDRDQSSTNRDFDRLERGDVVDLQKTQRILRETRIRKWV